MEVCDECVTALQIFGDVLPFHCGRSRDKVIKGSIHLMLFLWECVQIFLDSPFRWPYGYICGSSFWTIALKKIAFVETDSKEQSCIKSGLLNIIKSYCFGLHLLFCWILTINWPCYKVPQTRKNGDTYWV